MRRFIWKEKIRLEQEQKLQIERAVDAHPYFLTISSNANPKKPTIQTSSFYA